MEVLVISVGVMALAVFVMIICIIKLKKENEELRKTLENANKFRQICVKHLEDLSNS